MLCAVVPLQWLLSRGESRTAVLLLSSLMSHAWAGDAFSMHTKSQSNPDKLSM